MNKYGTFTFCSTLLLTGCELGGNDKTESQKLDDELQTLVVSKQISNIQAPTNNPVITSPLAQLGKQLFFSKSLSGDIDTACATCHHPNLGGSDQLPLSVGVAAAEPDLLGPGRVHDAGAMHHDGGPTIPRNSPTTFNVSLLTKSIFHDGRVEFEGADGAIRTPDVNFNTADPNSGDSLVQAQARFPVTSKEEMRGFNFVSDGDNQALRAGLEQRLQGNTNELYKNDWLELFRTALDQPNASASSLISFDNITLAIGAYEQSQLLIDNPWSDYLAGQTNAITDSAKRGALLFYKAKAEGGFNCASCHSGGLFSDENFHVVAMPQLGRGKGDGPNSDDDFGRFRETKIGTDKYAFRTPSLLNVTQTGPWGHSGAHIQLKQVVAHHLNPQKALQSYVPDDIQEGIQINNWATNTDNALAQLLALQSQGLSKLQIFDYSDEQLDDVLAFLKTLTDPCTTKPSCMNKWVPTEDENDPDGTRLIAIDQDGNAL